MTTRHVLIVGIVLAASAHADFLEAQTAVGIRVGADYATVSFGEPKPFQVESSAGSHISAVGSLKLSNRIQLQLEVARSVRGFGIGGSGFDGTVNMTYLEFPLLAVVNVLGDRDMTPRLLAGGVVSHEISCEFDVLVGGAPTPDDCDAPGNDFQNRGRTDSSLRFGGGIGMRFGAWTAFTDVLFDLGLKDLDEGAGATRTAHSRTWLLSVGVTHALGSR